MHTLYFWVYDVLTILNKEGHTLAITVEPRNRRAFFVEYDVCKCLSYPTLQYFFATDRHTGMKVLLSHCCVYVRVG